MFTSLIPFANAVLVSMHRCGEFMMLYTVDRVHRRSQRFMVNAANLHAWLRADDGSTFYDHDLCNYLAIHRFSADRVTVRFTWLTLHDSRGDRLHGYQQTLIMPVDRLNKALIGFRVKILVDTDVIPQCRLSFSGSAQELIRRICRDPQEKRALCKTMRENFHWRAAGEVYLVADWGRDFYFTTEGLNGGLCRHESIVKGKDGKAYRCVKYQLHT